MFNRERNLIYYVHKDKINNGHEFILLVNYFFYTSGHVQFCV